MRRALPPPIDAPPPEGAAESAKTQSRIVGDDGLPSAAGPIRSAPPPVAPPAAFTTEMPRSDAPLPSPSTKATPLPRAASPSQSSTVRAAPASPSTDTLRPLNRSPQFPSPRHVPGATSTREPSAAASIAACGVACTAHAVQPSGRTSTSSTSAAPAASAGRTSSTSPPPDAVGIWRKTDSDGAVKASATRDAPRAAATKEEGGGAFSGGPTAKRTVAPGGASK